MSYTPAPAPPGADCQPAPERATFALAVTSSAPAQAQYLLHGCGLPAAWGGQQAWRILDTQFHAERFLLTWQAWLADARRPHLLHYVALSPLAPDAPALMQEAASCADSLPLARELAAQCIGLLPGFHRLTLQQGQVLLTLCVGEPRALLREQQFAADSIFLDAPAAPDEWDRWDLKALARCCRRGTSLAAANASPDLLVGLAKCGFELQAGAGHFNPGWELKRTRESLRTRAATPATCAVIGAGLAGASVAAALARRGWQVTVLDSAPAPAAGASGLPAGLLLPHVSADDNPRSRLSRCGVRLMLQQLRGLATQGRDWDACGVLEHRVDRESGLPAHWSQAGRDWSRPATDRVKGGAWSRRMADGVPSLWHAQAGWVKPSRLVQAWLALPGVDFRSGARVTALDRQAQEWLLLDANGRTLAKACHLVLANACGALPLLDQLAKARPELWSGLAQMPALHGMRGAVSWGLRQADDAHALPPFPVNGQGSLIPCVPLAEGRAWFAGATYEAADQTGAPAGVHHHANLEKLRSLLPAAAEVLGPVFSSGQVQSWEGIRCVSADRLPLVGALEGGDAPSLWISAGLGSRGLSFSVLCAELLAARLGAEPLPVEASLARLLNPLRAAQDTAHQAQARQTVMDGTPAQ